MKRTIYDTPFNQGRPAKATFDDEVRATHRPGTLKALAAEYGVHPDAITTFRRRHPEVAHWTTDQVAAQVAKNKNMSYVAKRQQKGTRKGWRNTFGSIDYGDEHEATADDSS